MKGAVFFSSKYGSTAQYAKWIAEATGLPIFDTKNTTVNPSTFDFLIIGAPIIYYKLFNRKWLRRNWPDLQNKPILLFTVSGAPAGTKLDGWITNSNLPAAFMSTMKHVSLRGRQKPEELTIYDRIMLKIGGMKNPDPVARREELHGFDYMDKSSIAPIIEFTKQFEMSAV